MLRPPEGHEGLAFCLFFLHAEPLKEKKALPHLEHFIGNAANKKSIISHTPIIDSQHLTVRSLGWTFNNLTSQLARHSINSNVHNLLILPQ